MFQYFVLVFLSVVQAKNSLVWLCLERCPGFDFNTDLSMLKEHKSDIQWVSHENWQVGDKGQFQFATHNGANVSDVGPKIAEAGFPLFPMLTSANIVAMRILFAGPQSFIAEAIATAKKNHYIGYHIDFEPEHGVVKGDAMLYANFVDNFAKALHSEGMILGIDIATWSVLWDFELLGKTAVDKIYTMATYTNNITHIAQEVKILVDSVGLSKAAIGFDSDITKVDTWPGILPILKQNRIDYVGLWRDNQPIPAAYFKFISEFLSAE